MVDAEAFDMTESDTPGAVGDGDPSSGAIDALSALESWLRETIDDPAGDTATVHAARLAELARGSSAGAVGERLESIAPLVAVLGATIAANHRRTLRTGFDLHDGAIQHLLVTALELQTLRRGLQELPTEIGRKPLERLSTVHGRLVALEGELRDLAHSLETPSWSDVPLEQSVRNELVMFERESGIELHASIDGDFSRTSRSQRIAVLRVLQSALANVRHHSGARNVRVALAATPETIELTVEDDGHGFVMHDVLGDAVDRGRLGIVAMGERIRLLGGEFNLDSGPGGPTRIFVSLRPQPQTGIV